MHVLWRTNGQVTDVHRSFLSTRNWGKERRIELPHGLQILQQKEGQYAARGGVQTYRQGLQFLRGVPRSTQTTITQFHTSAREAQTHGEVCSYHPSEVSK